MVPTVDEVDKGLVAQGYKEPGGSDSIRVLSNGEKYIMIFIVSNNGFKYMVSRE